MFAAVAEQLATNRKRRRESHRGAKYLLQGLVVCGGCGYAFYGKPLSRSSGKGKTRHYAYYRCIGTDAYRFGGKRVCENKQCRTDVLDRAVWDDVCALLADPDRVRREYEMRRSQKRVKGTRASDQVGKLIAQVKRGIARLIDAYEEGLLDKAENGATRPGGQGPADETAGGGRDRWESGNRVTPNWRLRSRSWRDSRNECEVDFRQRTGTLGVRFCGRW